MRAAVLHETGQDKLEVLDDVEASGFGPGKVRIRVRATGLCHSDLSAMNGVLPQPAPFVPGHEGAARSSTSVTGSAASRKATGSSSAGSPPAAPAPPAGAARPSSVSPVS